MKPIRRCCGPAAVEPRGGLLATDLQAAGLRELSLPAEQTAEVAMMRADL